MACASLGGAGRKGGTPRPLSPDEPTTGLADCIGCGSGFSTLVSCNADGSGVISGLSGNGVDAGLGGNGVGAGLPDVAEVVSSGFRRLNTAHYQSCMRLCARITKPRP